MNIFNTHLTFNKSELYNKINMRIAERKTGYVCVCDSSVIARLQHDLEYREVINGSFVNTCDGSLIVPLQVKSMARGWSLLTDLRYSNTISITRIVR